MRPSYPGPLLCLALLLVSCGGFRDVELLSLSGLEGEQAEPGSTLHVLGSGLPVGRSGEVTLSGRVRRPGAPERTVSATVVGRALSEDEVAFSLDHAAFEALGAHGSFVGELRLSFAAHGGRDRVSGRLPVELDLVQPMARGPVHAKTLRERAERVLQLVGIVPTEHASTLSGLVIDWTTPGSVAERAGLRHGDVIERAGGVAVHALGDLAPPPRAHALSLQVRTPPRSRARPVSLDLAGLDAPAIDVGAARLSVLVCWVALCLLLLSMLPAPGSWIAAAIARLRGLRPASLGLWGGARGLQPPTPASRGLLARAERIALRGLWPAACSLAAALLIMLEPAGFLRLRSLSIYLAFAALSVGLTLLSEGGSLRARVAAAADAGFRMLVLMVVILCACALSGTRTFDGLVEGQGAYPWQWAVFCKPALLLSLPLYVVYAARLGGATLALGDAGGSGHGARLLVGERVLTNVVLCAVGVAVYAGGWQCPPVWMGEGVPPRLIGALLFVLKCWGFAGVLHLSRRMALGAGLRWSTVAGTCLGIVALTALSLHVPPGPTLELALGRGLFGAFVIAGWVGLLRALTTAHPLGVPPRPVAPFS